MNSFMFKPWVIQRLFPFIGGVLYPMGFPMKGIPHFMGLSFVGLFLFLQSIHLPYGHTGEDESSFKNQLISLLLFSLGYCLVGYYWIPYTLEEFGSIPFPFNTMLGTFFSLIIVPQYLAFIILLFFWKRLNLKKSSLAGGLGTRHLIFAFVLTLLENFIPQQFPAHIGHTWLQLAPRLGLVPLLGAPFLSFVSYGLIFSFVGLWRTGKMDFISPLIFIVTLALNLFSPLHYNPKNSEKNPKTLNIRLVQANVGNFMKLDSESGGISSMREIYQRYLDMSSESPAESKVFAGEPIDLIVWPETAYPQLLNTSMMRVTPAFVPTTVRRSVKASGAQLFFGGYDKSTSNNRNYFETEYNAGFLINREGKINDVYHKMLLIPFGESLPFGPLNPLLAKVIQNMAFFAKGQKYTLFELDGSQKFISAICYEILFSGFIRTYLNSTPSQADFIINLTNDSWYGDTSEPYQHQFLAFWRALEFQIPIVRMTNTGISSVLYPDGSESQRLEVFEQKNLDLKLKLSKRDPTFFQKWGLLPLTAIFLVIFFFVWFVEKRKAKKEN